ncbi:MAG: hypothetical protein EOP38_05215 [Rubrivivax sp.]|nr:MAG: hypothetical protein EOP38_05215 [Rubrivivax sp.]
MNAIRTDATDVAGVRNIDIGIGGFQVRLRTDSDALAHVLGERFAGFLAAVIAPDYVFDVELVPPRPAGDEQVRIQRTDAGWRMQRGDFLAEWNATTRRGHVRMLASPYSLDTLVRVLMTLVLADEGGMLMHASSVVLDGRAVVFTGVSGVGKTTISRLAPTRAHILTDEMSCIRRSSDGYIAHGTPFSGELGRPGENLNAPLAGVFLLAQGPENRVDTLPPAEAVRGLMANILFLADDRVLVQQVFDNAIALAARVPVRRLTFLPDARVWDMIGKLP